MGFTIEHSESKRDSLDAYRYLIYEDSRLIAHYWHDARGDEHGIKFINSGRELAPGGAVTDFVEGGGPKPLVLSARAVEYIKTMQADIKTGSK